MDRIKSQDIRQSFIDYFKDRDHSHQSSSPVIPFDDPTLLFVNAGMNQFKDVFTGSRKVSYKRAVSSQKCIRAGGKHNDLENVGLTNRHHTFFEMLGNFSFGDYFKEEAIFFAWDWITQTMGLDKSRLYATVYEEDDEAFALWEKIAPELKNGRLLRFGKKDNFWSMGDVGPCGPCSEIHYDMGSHLSRNDPDAAINTENDRYVELWNLVFMQYDQPPGGGEMVTLPKPSVDTGLGFERIAAVMQGVDTNYETDLFRPLTARVAEIAGVEYHSDKRGLSHRVIADHCRALSFALADGGGLSNEGRGYVLRRILRRGARHGRLLDYTDPIIYKLVPTLIEIMGEYFGELKERQPHIEAVIKSEEERFGELLGTGLELFSDLAKKVKSSGSDTIDGSDIFKLYDTYGFPVDMTSLMAEDAGLKMDMAGFEKAMTVQQEKSRVGSKFGAITGQLMKDFIEGYKLGDSEKTEFVRIDPQSGFETKTEIVFINDGFPNQDGTDTAVILKKSPFYVESGGQVADTGIIECDEFQLKLNSLENYQDITIHIGTIIKGSIDGVKSGHTVTARVDEKRRRDIMRNHTATHLMHAALRKVLGDHVKQAGSVVDNDHLRFDFSHYQAMTPEQVAEIERLVNEQILKATDVKTVEMPADEAKKSGAMALFGEKYGDTVRVVSVSGFSKELCGGTHVSNTAEIGSFMITEETAIASGVRRIEAVTGRGAWELAQTNKQVIGRIGTTLNVPGHAAAEAVKNLSTSLSNLQKENKKLKSERFSGGSGDGGGGKVGKQEKVGAIDFYYHDFGQTDQESMAGWSDSIAGKNEAAGSFAVGELEGKKTFMASASAAAIKTGFDCGRDFGSMIRELGGRGGGKSKFARGSLPDGLDFAEVVAKAKKKIEESQK